MALSRLTIDGYGVLELNHVAFRRDGRIVAQCALASGIEYVENGMLLAVDETARKIKMPSGNDEFIALNYTTEHMYDERHRELKNFKLEKNSFLPRLGYLAQGDKFTTNCIAYDTAEFSDDAAVKTAVSSCATTAVYGKACSNGAIQLTASNSGALVKVCYGTTLPNGDYGVKFIAL